MLYCIREKFKASILFHNPPLCMISGQAFIDVSPAPKAKGYTTKYFLPEGQLNMAVFFVFKITERS
nr:MAG TPA: hypothetical protein [Caudoviricetes sp.]